MHRVVITLPPYRNYAAVRRGVVTWLAWLHDRRPGWAYVMTFDPVDIFWFEPAAALHPVADWCIAAQEDGRGIYASLGRVSRPKDVGAIGYADGAEYSVLWREADDASVDAVLWGVPPPHAIIQTSPDFRHWHLYWKLARPWRDNPVSRGRSWHRSILKGLNVNDDETGGSKFNLRIPGGYHSKPEKDLWRLVNVFKSRQEHRRRYEIAEFADYGDGPQDPIAPAPRSPGHRRRNAGKREEAYVRAALENAYQEVASCREGGRHEAFRRQTYALAGLLHTGYIDEDEITQAMIAACEENGLGGHHARTRAADIIAAGRQLKRRIRLT